MIYEELSIEAKTVLMEMVEFCLDNARCLGQDEGIKDFDTMEEHEFVKELREFVRVE